MPTVTANQLHFSLSKLLKFGDEGTMPAYWDDTVAEAATFAYNEVRGVLESRGFSLTDVQNWDRLLEVTRDLGLWRSIVMGGAYGKFDPEVIKALDRRQELHTILVAVNDQYLKPASGEAGMAATGGPMRDDPNATFNYQGGPDNEPHYGIQW